VPEELECHIVKAERDGRSGHCIIVRAQPLADSDWPERLKDRRGEPVLYRDLADPDTKLPIGIDNLDEPRLRDGIRNVYIEIRQRLEEYCKYPAERRSFETRPQVPPEKPVIYLHARPQDLPAWQDARQKLGMKAIVNPASLPNPADDVYIPEKRNDKLREYSLCNGVALLRAKDADIRLDIMIIYRDRQRFYQEDRRNIPWAIVDQVGDEFPVAADYGVPRVPASNSNPNWPDELLQKLSLG
jgi:hypothetical protein